MQVAFHLINRTPFIVLDYKTPYECLFGKPPTMTDINFFGCLCYAYNISRGGDKFASRIRRCVFVGYSYIHKGWKLYDLETHKYFVSRDVKFLENTFPFVVSEPINELVVEGLTGVDELLDEEIPVLAVEVPIEVEGGHGDGDDMEVASAVDAEPRVEEVSAMEAEPRETSPTDVARDIGTQEGCREDGGNDFGREKRAKIANKKLQDSVTHNVVKKKSSTTQDPVSISCSGTSYPITHYLSYEKFYDKNRRFLAAIIAGHILRNHLKKR